MRDPGLDPREHLMALLVVGALTLLGAVFYAWLFYIAGRDGAPR